MVSTGCPAGKTFCERKRTTRKAVCCASDLKGRKKEREREGSHLRCKAGSLHPAAAAAAAVSAAVPAAAVAAIR